MSAKLFSLHFAMTITVCLLLTGPVFAGDAGGKSGLDLDRGYDVNTVTTVTGKVIAQPHSTDREAVIIEVNSSNEKVYLSVGPSSYWEKHGIPLRLNDEISAKGSKSQGKDGNIYLLVRKLENRTTGSQVEMRNGQGEAVWNGASIRPAMGAMGERPTGGQRQQGSGMMRGGGGMMHR